MLKSKKEYRKFWEPNFLLKMLIDVRDVKDLRYLRYLRFLKGERNRKDQVLMTN